MIKFKGSIYLLGISICLLFFTACEKEVHINLKGSASTVVVEGEIETGLPPFVVLTSSFGYFSNINLSTIENSFVHGALVKVTNGADTITLREYTIDTSSGATYSFYTIDTAHLTHIIVGEVEKYYTLIITYNGTTYTSTTKIPTPAPVDSMWVDVPQFARPNTPDSAKELYVNYKDPDTIGNHVRYFTKRNNEMYYPGQAIFSDELVNGTYIKNLGLFAGYNRAANVNADSLRFFYPGDTISLKWCSIDKSVFNFYNSLAYANAADNNPFASPINVQSNISNGALGIWAGYGTYFRTLIVPR